MKSLHPSPRPAEGECGERPTNRTSKREAAAQKLWQIERNNSKDHEIEEQLIDKWTSDPPTTSIPIFHIKAAQERTARRIQAHNRQVITARTIRNIARLIARTWGCGSANTVLSKPSGRPLFFVPDDQGQITADLEVLDGRATQAWQKIYQGVGGDEDETLHHQASPPSRPRVSSTP